MHWKTWKDTAFIMVLKTFWLSIAVKENAFCFSSICFHLKSQVGFSQLIDLLINRKTIILDYWPEKEQDTCKHHVKLWETVMDSFTVLWEHADKQSRK